MGPEDDLFWSGRVQLGEVIGSSRSTPSSPATLGLHAWDIDTNEHALLSSQNRFQFSPDWRFDESGNPVFEGASGGIIPDGSPPPVLPEDRDRECGPANGAGLIVGGISDICGGANTLS